MDSDLNGFCPFSFVRNKICKVIIPTFAGLAIRFSIWDMTRRESV